MKRFVHFVAIAAFAEVIAFILGYCLFLLTGNFGIFLSATQFGALALCCAFGLFK